MNTQQDVAVGLRRVIFRTLILAFLGSAFLDPPNSQAKRSTPCCGEITAAGRELETALDNMNVGSLWLAHLHVNWETGEPDHGGKYEGPNKHTHCSAFAAAAAMRMGVYLLRPPQHGQQFLANAQAEWLSGEAGRLAGWREINGDEDAQREANRGNMVVVTFRNPDPHQPGHVAVVRPSEKTLTALEHSGPQIIQAGTHNHASTTVRVGFSNHAGAWPSGVRYFVHSL